MVFHVLNRGGAGDYFWGAKGNSATRPPDKRPMVLRPVSAPRVLTREGAALFGIDANCHESLSQGGLPLRAIWHNGHIAIHWTFRATHNFLWLLNKRLRIRYV